MRMDRSYIANSFLWDKWFMSSVGTQNNSFFQESGYTRRPLSKVSEDFFNGVKALPNENFVPNSTLTPQQIKEALFNGTIVREEAYQRVAEFLLIAGGFNVNSISETAWQHYLASMLSRDLLVMLPGEAPKKLDREEGKFSISRYPLSIGGVAVSGAGSQLRTDRLVVGGAGEGALSITSGGQVISQGAVVGAERDPEGDGVAQ